MARSTALTACRKPSAHTLTPAIVGSLGRLLLRVLVLWYGVHGHSSLPYYHVMQGDCRGLPGSTSSLGRPIRTSAHLLTTGLSSARAPCHFDLGHGNYRPHRTPVRPNRRFIGIGVFSSLVRSLRVRSLHTKLEHNVATGLFVP